jgi:hypothetical protein
VASQIPSYLDLRIAFSYSENGDIKSDFTSFAHVYEVSSKSSNKSGTLKLQDSSDKTKGSGNEKKYPNFYLLQEQISR